MDERTVDFLAALYETLHVHLTEERVTAALVAVERVMARGEDPVDVARWLRTHIVGQHQAPAQPERGFGTI